MIHRRNLNICHLLVIILSTLILGGCDTLSYYQQMGAGHLDLMNKRELISKRINASDIDPEEKRKLELVVSAKKFAITHLNLPANSSYRHYSDLNRPYVTWNVVATKPLSMTPTPSCFPIVGCLSYRGYFKESDAKRYAKQLEQQGLETYIAGSTAYSTLGWFDDPVVSTMLRYDDYFLLETLFHELAHQKIYFPNDSDFNEAFASAIGQYGVRKWLEMNGTKQDIQDYEVYLNRRTDFTTMLRNTADELRHVFKQNGKSKGQLLAEKNTVYAKLKNHYREFKQKNAYNGYDNWFLKPVNNPRLAIISTYHDLVSDFITHLEKCDNNTEQFYRSISTLRTLSQSARKKFLLSSGACVLKEPLIKSD